MEEVRVCSRVGVARSEKLFQLPKWSVQHELLPAVLGPMGSGGMEADKCTFFLHFPILKYSDTESSSDRAQTSGEQLRQGSDERRAAPTGLRRAESSSDRAPTSGEQLRTSGPCRSCSPLIGALPKLVSARRSPVGAALRSSGPCRSCSPRRTVLGSENAKKKCTCRLPYRGAARADHLLYPEDWGLTSFLWCTTAHGQTAGESCLQTV